MRFRLLLLPVVTSISAKRTGSACPLLQSRFSSEASIVGSSGCPCFGHPGLPVPYRLDHPNPWGPSPHFCCLAAWHCGADRACWRACAVCSGCSSREHWIRTYTHRDRLPEIDASGREVVILGGCVVEPPAVSGERERFLLELDRDARAQVTLYIKPGETLPRAALRAEYRAGREGAPAAQFRQSGGVRLPAIPGAAGHLLDRVGGGGDRTHPAGTLRQSRFRKQ